MSLRFITSVLSIGAVIATVSAVPAKAGNDEFGRFLGAAATLFIIGSIIEAETRDHRDSKVKVHKPSKPVVTKRAPKPVVTRAPSPLPRKCMVSVNSSNTNNVMTRQCLEKNYRSASRLPNACGVTLRGKYDRPAYSVRCLRKRGYVVAGR